MKRVPARLRAVGRVTRGLRFRLMLSYVLFFTVLMVAMGFLFRESLRTLLERRMRDVVEEEWGSVKGFLKIEGGKSIWMYDSVDPEEASIVERLRRSFLLLTTLDGKAVLEVSNSYRTIGVESPQEITDLLKQPQPVWRIRTDTRDEKVIVKSGTIVDSGKTYFLALGRSLGEDEGLPDRFAKYYFAFLPAMIAISGLLGWYTAGRALYPVIELAKTAGDVSSSNLNIRIPSRGAGDELDHLIETFNNMMERLQKGIEQIRQFSTDVSHELRTPLTAIRGQLEVALFTAKTTEHYKDAMVNALQDVERLSQIVRALLMLSQAESGQLPLLRQEVDMSMLTADIVDQFQIPAEDARVHLVSDIPPKCLVDGDRVQLERLLYNLLSNAIKYTDAGGSVKASLHSGEEWVELSIEDTGKGIPAEYLPHIFDRFYRVPGHNDPEKGLGLGLSFVAWIVKAHGGEIKVRSEAGKGTEFLVRLPKAGAVTEKEAA
jgi:heavy metal sensor kinase